MSEAIQRPAHYVGQRFTKRADILMVLRDLADGYNYRVVIDTPTQRLSGPVQRIVSRQYGQASERVYVGEEDSCLMHDIISLRVERPEEHLEAPRG